MLFLIILFISTKSTTSWKEESANSFDFDKIPDFLSLLDEHQKMCNNGDDNKECQYLMSENIKDYSIKRKLIEASKLPLHLMVNNVRIIRPNQEVRIIIICIYAVVGAGSRH